MIVDAATRLSSRAKIAGAFGIGFGFFAGAGVTGLSLLIGILGIWAWIIGLRGPDRPILAAIKSSARHQWLAWGLFVAFIGWVLVTALWSPAVKLSGESTRRILAMALLVPAAVWAVSSRESHEAKTLHYALLAGLGIAIFILLFETVTSASINKIASPEKDILAIDGDLGRAATATLALFWALFACIKTRLKNDRTLVFFVAASIFLAFQFGTDLNAIGLFLGSCAALFALSFPRIAIGIISGSCALIMITAPMLYPFITKLAAGLVPGGALPLSYARRAQMWQVSADLIAQHPFKGWGLGAGSTFDRIISFGGFDWPLIQLHPHAAPLHIWLETGAIGAALASLVIVMAGLAAMSIFKRYKIAAAVLVGGMTFLAINWAFSHAAWREWMWTSFAFVLALALSLRQAPAKSNLDD